MYGEALFVLSAIESRNLIEAAALRNAASGSVLGQRGVEVSRRVPRGGILNSALAEKPNKYLEASMLDNIHAWLFDLPGARPFQQTPPAPPGQAKH